VVVALAHFIADGTGLFEPTEFALSRWGKDTLNGPAIVGLAARSLESEYGRPGFLPARLTTDLFKSARRVPTLVRTRLVRDGHRILRFWCHRVGGAGGIECHRYRGGTVSRVLVTMVLGESTQQSR
jgi:hypothetical protein